MNLRLISTFTFNISEQEIDLSKHIGSQAYFITGYYDGIDEVDAITRTHIIYGALKLLGHPYVITLCDFECEFLSRKNAITFILPIDNELTGEELQELVKTVEHIKKVAPPYICKAFDKLENAGKIKVIGRRIAANKANYNKLSKLGEILG